MNKEVQAISKEVMPAMNRIKTGKVIGADGIRVQVWRGLGQRDIFRRLFDI